MSYHFTNDGYDSASGTVWVGYPKAFSPGMIIRGWEIYCYARKLINSHRTEEPREWCQTKGAEAAKPLPWKRKRRHDNFPPMRTKIFKTSKDVIGLDWLQKLKKEGEFLFFYFLLKKH